MGEWIGLMEAGALLVAAVLTIRWLRARAEAGAVLVRLGAGRNEVIPAVAASMAAVPVLLGLLRHGKSGGVQLSLVLVALGGVGAVTALLPTELCEQGVVTFALFVRWQDVASYEWRGEDTVVLTLVRPHRLGSLQLAVPAARRAAVERVLATRLPWLTPRAPDATTAG